MCFFSDFTRASVFVLGLVILCFVSVVIWLSLPVQSIAWKDSSVK